jgi:hypothetical protein
MKKTITLMLFVIVATVLTSCGPTKEEAIAYNDKIINEQVNIIDKINALYDAMKNYEYHYGMDYAYAEALKQADKGTEVVGKLEKFGGSTEFRDEALKLFGTYKSIMQNEIKKMIDINKLTDDMYTEEAQAEFDKLADISSKKMEDGLQELNAVQQKFADKYKFEIEKKKK